MARSSRRILGLPFAFASHFAPAMLLPAIEIYRQRFRPSPQLAAPHVMLGVTCVAAETDAEARFLFSSLQQNTLEQPHRAARPGAAADREFRGVARSLCPRHRRRRARRRGGRRAARRCAQGLDDFVRVTGADELMITANIFDHEKRKRSFEIVAELHGGMKPSRAAPSPAEAV